MAHRKSGWQGTHQRHKGDRQHLFAICCKDTLQPENAPLTTSSAEAPQQSCRAPQECCGNGISHAGSSSCSGEHPEGCRRAHSCTYSVGPLCQTTNRPNKIPPPVGASPQASDNPTTRHNYTQTYTHTNRLCLQTCCTIAKAHHQQLITRSSLGGWGGAPPSKCGVTGAAANKAVSTLLTIKACTNAHKQSHTLHRHAAQSCRASHADQLPATRKHPQRCFCKWPCNAQGPTQPTEMLPVCHESSRGC